MEETQRMLQEYTAEAGTLTVLAVSVPPEENRKIRDEIRRLAEGKVKFLNIDMDSIRAEIYDGATEETIRRFEDAGWGWG